MPPCMMIDMENMNEGDDYHMILKCNNVDCAYYDEDYYCTKNIVKLDETGKCTETIEMEEEGEKNE